MKEMINRLCGSFLVAALVVMPLYGMQPGVAIKAADNVAHLNELVEQAHKTIYAALGTFTSPDQKQQKHAVFEVEKAEFVRLMGKTDLAAINLNKINLNAKVKLAQLLEKVGLKEKIKLAPLMATIDFKTKMKLAELMRMLDLDGEVKKAMSDAIKTIQNTRVATQLVPNDVAWESIKESQDAYNRLHDTVDCITEVVASQNKIQQIVDYVSRKFQEVKRAVGTLWYGKANKE